MILSETTRSIVEADEKALVPFLTAGYPDENTFCDLLRATVEAGCRVIEIGIPFSDPMADGPVIQAASRQALENGMSLRRAIELTAKVSRDHPAAFVFMSYLNPILQMGFAKFAERASAAGVAGVIIPDLPLEESAEIRQILAKQNVTIIDLISPMSDQDRIGRIAAVADGWLYLVSLTGVTGVKTARADELVKFVSRVREATEMPLYVGFGISTAEQASKISELADGVIIGSALIKIIREAPTGGAIKAVGDFLAEVRSAINRQSRS